MAYSNLQNKHTEAIIFSVPKRDYDEYGTAFRRNLYRETLVKATQCKFNLLTLIGALQMAGAWSFVLFASVHCFPLENR